MIMPVKYFKNENWAEEKVEKGGWELVALFISSQVV